MDHSPSALRGFHQAARMTRRQWKAETLISCCSCRTRTDWGKPWTHSVRKGPNLEQDRATGSCLDSPDLGTERLGHHVPVALARVLAPALAHAPLLAQYHGLSASVSLVLANREIQPSTEMDLGFRFRRHRSYRWARHTLALAVQYVIGTTGMGRCQAVVSGAVVEPAQAAEAVAAADLVAEAAGLVADVAALGEADGVPAVAAVSAAVQEVAGGRRESCLALEPSEEPAREEVPGVCPEVREGQPRLARRLIR